MREDEEFKKALRQALGKLASGDRFAKEIEDLLLQKGTSPATTAEVVSYLKERRFVDDRKATINAVERRSGRRAIGRDKLRAELLRRGAPEDMIEEAFSNLPQDSMEADALGLLQAKYGRPDAGNSGARTRAGRFLAAKGFELESIEHALDCFFGPVDDLGG
jgi:SOS response regulatory protein OraA/RecX